MLLVRLSQPLGVTASAFQSVAGFGTSMEYPPGVVYFSEKW